jgi:hypothetical protein
MPDEMSKLLSKRLATCEDPETRAFLQILLLGNEQVAQGKGQTLTGHHRTAASVEVCVPQ